MKGTLILKCIQRRCVANHHRVQVDELVVDVVVGTKTIQDVVLVVREVVGDLLLPVDVMVVTEVVMDGLRH